MTHLYHSYYYLLYRLTAFYSQSSNLSFFGSFRFHVYFYCFYYFYCYYQIYSVVAVVEQPHSAIASIPNFLIVITKNPKDRQIIKTNDLYPKLNVSIDYFHHHPQNKNYSKDFHISAN